MSILGLWIDGKPQNEASILALAGNRGLQYGDGLFETMLLNSEKIRLLPFHLDRLQDGCRRLDIEMPSRKELERTLCQLPRCAEQAVVKLLVIRGGTGRGYRPTSRGAQCWIYLSPYAVAPRELNVRWCETRLGRNPALAGMKHLNRLEQVLAQNELGAFDEGLMLDTNEQVISATAGNVFVVQSGEILTPKLDACGVRGVMRRYVIETACALGWCVRECALHPSDFDDAQEVFITNALRGVRSVRRVESREYAMGEVTGALIQSLSDTCRYHFCTANLKYSKLC